MQQVRKLFIVTCVGFIAFNATVAQETESKDVSEFVRQSSPKKDPKQPQPNTRVEELIQVLEQEDVNQEVAKEKLAKIKDDITELITKYPSTQAAKEAAQILDKAGLKVIPKYGVYDKGVVVFTIPITR